MPGGLTPRHPPHSRRAWAAGQESEIRRTAKFARSGEKSGPEAALRLSGPCQCGPVAAARRSPPDARIAWPKTIRTAERPGDRRGEPSSSERRGPAVLSRQHAQSHPPVPDRPGRSHRAAPAADFLSSCLNASRSRRAEFIRPAIISGSHERLDDRPAKPGRRRGGARDRRPPRQPCAALSRSGSCRSQTSSTYGHRAMRTMAGLGRAHASQEPGPADARPVANRSAPASACTSNQAKTTGPAPPRTAS